SPARPASWRIAARRPRRPRNPGSGLARSQSGKAGIKFSMRTALVGHPRSRQAALRGDKAVDTSARPFMPADVEGGQFGEELQLGVREVVMDRPGECGPIRTVTVAIGKPWHDDGRHRPHSSRGIATVPYVAAIIA